jgi:hypothetical protein
MNKFFFNRHALPLLALLPFGKSPADLISTNRSDIMTDKRAREKLLA